MRYFSSFLEEFLVVFIYHFFNVLGLCMLKNNPTSRCTINIVNDATPIFVINNLGPNTGDSSVCANVMNTITLPPVQFYIFNDKELSLIQAKDVFFIQDIGQSDVFTASMDRLMKQGHPCCRVSKIINLSNFINVNSIDSNVDTANLFDVRKLFNNIDDSSFVDLLIYFANFNEEDLEFTIETYCQFEFDVDEINSLMKCYQEVINEK